MELDFSKLPRFKNFEVKIRQLIPEWAFAYHVPIDAIERQLAFAHGWILTNPKKAPKKDIPRFLFNWMRSAQKWGNLRPTPAPVRQEPAQTAQDLTEADLREMHAQKVATIGCRAQGCQFCGVPA